jgi:hypothetical protein
MKKLFTLALISLTFGAARAECYMTVYGTSHCEPVTIDLCEVLSGCAPRPRFLPALPPAPARYVPPPVTTTVCDRDFGGRIVCTSTTTR